MTKAIKLNINGINKNIKNVFKIKIIKLNKPLKIE